MQYGMREAKITFNRELEVQCEKKKKKSLYMKRND